MLSVNKVILLGNLGSDVELKTSANGNTPFVSLNVATSNSYKDKETQEWKTKTEWHKVSVFGKLAEACSKILHKGAIVYIEGRLSTNIIPPKEEGGEKKYVTNIIAYQVILAERKNNSNNASLEEEDASSSKEEEEDEIPF